jgi:hypothetical protein
LASIEEYKEGNGAD